MNVAAVLMEILRGAGVRYLFGNPGTTELPFLDALDGSTLDYVVGLQEATAVAAADGYAQASGRLGVVNVHVAPGVANGLSILHNAARSRSPLLVTAGQQDSRLLLHEPILSADLVQMTEQFTKWSYEVRRAEEAPAALRRAIKTALSPPTGPVFLALPMDLMTETVGDDGAPPPPVAGRARPEAEALLGAADLLAGARAPLIVAGDGVGRPGALPALLAVAELLGAGVHGEPIYRRTSFPGDHPLWRGGLYPSPAAVGRALADADVVLIVGASVFTWFLHGPGEPFRPGQSVIQVDDDPREIERSYPVSLGIVADPEVALRELAEALEVRLDEAARRGGGRPRAHPDLPGVPHAHPGLAPAGGRHRGGRVRDLAAVRAPVPSLPHPGVLLRLEDRDPRVGHGGGPRGTARGARPPGGGHHRRRLPHVRAPGPVDGGP